MTPRSAVPLWANFHRRFAASARGSVLLGLLSVANVARGDGTTGTWTGEVEARANAFYEHSSRVVVPEFQIETTAPSGLRLGAGYLIDVISSASIAQTGTDGHTVFTELRHGVDAHVGGELDLNTAQLDLTARGTFSREDDYTSINAGLASVLSLDQRATQLMLDLTHVRDTISSNVDPNFDETLRGVMASAAVERLIGPRIVLHVSYGLAYLEGFLGNAYRRALVGPLPFPEMHPRQRVRHNAAATLRVFVTETNTALHLSYRAYLDSWNIAALTPELRIYQHFGERLMLRLRYRYYTQTASYFFRRSYPAGWQGYVTNDPKMAPLQTHTAGLAVELRLPWLGQGWFDFGLDRYVSSSVFGDGVIASTGLRMGF